MADTLNQLFLEVVERCGDRAAILIKREGEWQRFSHAWALQQVYQTASGLHSFGFERGTRLAILSENRAEWATSDFGAIVARQIASFSRYEELIDGIYE